MFGKETTHSYSAYEVFVPGGLPVHTYVARTDRGLEGKIEEAQHNLCKIVTVTGATKSGKTVLVKRVLSPSSPLWLDGGYVHCLEDFWAIIGDSLQLELPESRTTSHERGYGASGELKGSISAFVAGGEATLAPSYMQKSGGTETGSPVTFVPSRIREKLERSRSPLVIDDFHYIPRNVQGSITRALKPLVFAGLPVVFLAIPHRRYDAVKVEKEMNGRVSQVAVPPWTDKELAQIPSLGFPLLGMDVPQAVLRRFENEAQGSPHLMQEFCRKLAITEGVRTTAIPMKRVSAQLDLAVLFQQVAEDLGKNIFDKLAQGPTQRSDRKERKLKQGGTADIYRVVLLALAGLRPKVETIDYESLRGGIREVLAEGIPQAHEVSRVLEKMARISSSDSASSPVIDYEKDERRLHVTDPFFAFFLRWGNEFMKSN